MKEPKKLEAAVTYKPEVFYVMLNGEFWSGPWSTQEKAEEKITYRSDAIYEIVKLVRQVRTRVALADVE